jgi:maltooligosyltrehalose trehalohydrolase
MPGGGRSGEKRLGAWVSGTGVEFRVWAPRRRRVEVEFSTGAPLSLASEGDGFFHGRAAGATAGSRYRFRLDDTESHPDPYSRHQPDGPHAPSSVVDPDAYRWRDAQWPGLDRERQVIYEMHVGTFTAAGTYAAATGQLAGLRELGITCIELMPVNQFQGRFGWGYDGVNWFAPYHPYGDPDALRRFVDDAHMAGLGVILDVVYNHFGHDGNYLPRFDADYLTDEFDNPWGGTPNYAHPAMRRLAIDNAAYWVREFHMDGLRLDAIHSIHDPQPPSLLAGLTEAARAAAGGRSIIISAEDFLQRGPLLSSSDAESADVDLLWNDDFHHASRVALTGNHVGFFKNYRGSAQEFVSCMCRGFLFQGQYDHLNNGPRGHSFHGRPLSSLVAFTQNHDAVANTLDGRRIAAMVGPADYRALTALLLLGPQTPLIFMGQEFAASAPFAYFADYQGPGAATLWQGRRKEAQAFETYRDPEAIACILDPCSADTVKRSTLDFSERERHPQTVRLFADLLKLRRTDAVLEARPIGEVAGAVLTEHAFVIRWFDTEHGDRLLLVNLGAQIEPRPWPEPLLAPAQGRRWRLAWSSESPAYGGMGAINPLAETGWQAGAKSASFLVSEL